MRPLRALARRHLQALSGRSMALARPRASDFLVTGITDTPHGVLFRVQRLEGGGSRALTDDIRVLHLDQLAIQITRGGIFYVKERRPDARQAVFHRLAIRRDSALRWSVTAGDVPGANDAVEALSAFPILGFVRGAFARDAVQRTWPSTDLAGSVV